MGINLERKVQRGAEQLVVRVSKQTKALWADVQKRADKAGYDLTITLDNTVEKAIAEMDSALKKIEHAAGNGAEG